jgi:hypothetical protein
MFKDCFKQDLIFICSRTAIKKGYTLEKEFYLRTIGFVPRARIHDPKGLYRYHAPNYDGLNRANSSFLRFQRQFSDTSSRSDPKIEKSSFQDLKILNKEITRNIIQLINQKL